MPALLIVVLLLTQAASLPVERGNLTIQGTLTDLTNRPFQGATVWVKAEGNRLPRTTISDELGRYSLSNLLPGKYELFAEAPDFAREQRTVDLTALTRLDITLRVKELPAWIGGVSAAQGDSDPPDPRIEATRKRRLAAERLVSELWQLTLRREDIEKVGEASSRLRAILTGIGELGTDAVGALVLGLHDTDSRSGGTPA
jgi:hypothetical protein